MKTRAETESEVILLTGLTARPDRLTARDETGSGRVVNIRNERENMEGRGEGQKEAGRGGVEEEKERRLITVTFWKGNVFKGG